MPQLTYILTHPMSARLLVDGQLAYFRQQGFEVAVICGPGHDLDTVASREGVEVRPVAMAREIDPLQDAVSLVRLAAALRDLRPDIVNAGTPKAGLLGMMAATLARVPVRVYTLHGLRLETTAGMRRRVLGATERAASGLAHRVVCVSESLRLVYVGLGLASAKKAIVLGAGSANGVDPDRFEPTSGRRDEAEALRARLGMPSGVPVVGFVGRFTRDKGVADLVVAFDQVLERWPEARLLLVGDFEPGDPLPPEVARRIEADPRIVRPGFVEDTSPFFPLMDVLALPSYREGFPISALEASAAGIPVVGFRSTGIVDAVEDGVTGTLVPKGDIDALAAAFATYLDRPELRSAHGHAGRDRVLRAYRRETVWEAWHDEYRRLLRRGPG